MGTLAGVSSSVLNDLKKRVYDVCEMQLAQTRVWWDEAQRLPAHPKTDVTPPAMASGERLLGNACVYALPAGNDKGQWKKE
jgi:hypothetical protein